MEQRIDKINYYLNIAKAVADRSTCLRKKSGAVIVNKDEIISMKSISLYDEILVSP